MRRIVGTILLLYISVLSSQAQEQQTKAHIYDPNADAFADIHTAVLLAKKQNKHILLQIGGNWCIWCKRFNELTTTDTTLVRVIDSNYIVVHVNYSPENKNLKVLESLSYPQRFGFPVFVVLNTEGKRMHTQNSGYLEEGPGHSKKKVEEFLRQWSPHALDPATYK